MLIAITCLFHTRHHLLSSLLPQPEGWLFCRRAKSRGPLGSAPFPRSAQGSEGSPRTQSTAFWDEHYGSMQFKSRYNKTILAKYEKRSSQQRFITSACIYFNVFLLFTWNNMRKTDVAMSINGEVMANWVCCCGLYGEGLGVRDMVGGWFGCLLICYTVVVVYIISA